VQFLNYFNLLPKKLFFCLLFKSLFLDIVVVILFFLTNLSLNKKIG